MSNRTLSILIFLVILGMGTLFTTNFLKMINTPKDAKFISLTDVRGMEVEKAGVLHTLNLSQQKDVIEILNLSIRITNTSYLKEQKDLGYQKVLIHRFDNPTLELIPITIINNQLIFKQVDWNPDGLLQEAGPGKLNEIFSQSLN